MRKNKNGILLIVLLILVAVFIATRLFRAPALESNLDTHLFAIDTSLIQSVTLAEGGRPELRLQKDASVWTVSKAEKLANADKDAIASLMRTLSGTKPERIVSRKEEKWSTYLVDDSTSIHMTAYDLDNEPIIDWHIGKESKGITYVRPADEQVIYAMEGSLRTPMKNEFSDWRDKTFLQVQPDEITRITFKYPSDTGFVLQHSSNRWMIDNQPADSTQVERYLLKLQFRKLRNFSDAPAPSRTPDIALSVETSRTSNPIVIKAWKDGESWTLNSTLQPGVYFRDSRTDDDLFASRTNFLRPDN